MNKYEVSEIKKAFNSGNGYFTLNQVAVCIVQDSDIKHSIVKSGALLNSREESMYYSILRSVLNTKVGKNFIQYEFMDQAYESGHAQPKLYAVVNEGLKSTNEFHDFMHNIILGYSSDAPYAIVCAQCTYVVRHKDKSGLNNLLNTDDFNFIVTAICPVISVDSGFSYNYATGEFSTESDNKLYIQPKPTDGFMYPAFDNRSADVNSVMYYCKKSADADISIISDVLECNFIRTADQEKEIFQYVIHTALGDSANYAFMYVLNERLCELADSHSHDTRLYCISMDELTDILTYIGVSDDLVSTFKVLYQKYVGEYHLTLNNLIEAKMKLKTSEYTISFSKSMGDKVSTVVTEGVRTIKLKTDDQQMEVNGTEVSI
jgi:hypothetical protein